MKTPAMRMIKRFHFAALLKGAGVAGILVLALHDALSAEGSARMA